ncbi:MAG: hypothetical protein V3R66_06930, partial [Rhodospirillales bacterium]
MVTNGRDSGPERCIVVHPNLRSKHQNGRDPEARLSEAVGLAEAIHLSVVISETVQVSKVSPSTLFGKG